MTDHLAQKSTVVHVVVMWFPCVRTVRLKTHGNGFTVTVTVTVCYKVGFGLPPLLLNVLCLNVVCVLYYYVRNHNDYISYNITEVNLTVQSEFYFVNSAVVTTGSM